MVEVVDAGDRGLGTGLRRGFWGWWVAAAGTSWEGVESSRRERKLFASDGEDAEW